MQNLPISTVTSYAVAGCSISLKGDFELTMPKIGWKCTSLDNPQTVEVLVGIVIKKGIRMIYIEEDLQNVMMCHRISNLMKMGCISRSQLFLILNWQHKLACSIDTTVYKLAIDELDLIVKARNAIDRSIYPTPFTLIKSENVRNNNVSQHVNSGKNHYAFDFRKINPRRCATKFVMGQFHCRPVAFIEKLRVNCCVSPREFYNYFKSHYMMYVVEVDPTETFVENPDLFELLGIFCRDATIIRDESYRNSPNAKAMIISNYLFQVNIPQILVTADPDIVEKFLKINCSKDEINLNVDQLMAIDRKFKYIPMSVMLEN